MYTTRHLNDDLYQICKIHYVKMALLKDYFYGHKSNTQFVTILEDDFHKDQQEIAMILNKFQQIHLTIQQHGGQIVRDPFEIANDLRKANRLKEAYQTASEALRQDPTNEDGAVTFGWIVYDYMKRHEANPQNYMRLVQAFNDHCQLNFANAEKIEMLKTSFLWSFRRAIQQNKDFANQLLPEILRFCQHDARFIEERYLLFGRDKGAAERSLIKDIRGELSDANYFIFMNAIGFAWFDGLDYKESKFETSDGENVVVPPLAELVLNYHAKKLIAAPESETLHESITAYIAVLTEQIKKNPSFEWLPYHKVKLLMRVQQREEALELATDFGRTKSQAFWVWDLLSELVTEDQKLNCLSAALLCKAKPEMLVTIQQKTIALLVKEKQYAQAKYELDQLINIRMHTWGKVAQTLLDLKKEHWYSSTEAATSRDGLKPYAEQAEGILYETLPLRDIFVTYINAEKHTVHFIYGDVNVHKGYFYSDSVANSIELKVDQSYRAKMLEDRHKEELFKVWTLEPGDPAYVKHFVKQSQGLVDKGDTQPFAFIDDVYISPKLVEQHGLDDGDYIVYVKKRTFNKKRNQWSWSVVEVKSVTTAEEIDITLQSYEDLDED